MAERLTMSPSDYISYVIRTYPELRIIEDISWKDSAY
jgi:hypothetical protein